MKRRFLNSKIHKATVTDSRIDYEGSCEIDRILLESAGIEPYEQIDIYNITNGERFTTYAIEGKPESGRICVNGAACHKADIGHNIIHGSDGEETAKFELDLWFPDGVAEWQRDVESHIYE